MAQDPEFAAHQEWLGYLQPVGLVVSPAALVAAGAVPTAPIAPVQTRFVAWVRTSATFHSPDGAAVVEDLPGMLQAVFDWEARDLLGAPGAPPLPEGLAVSLPEYHETLAPTFVVPRPKSAPGEGLWLMLVDVLPVDRPLDEPAATHDQGWHASPEVRFERLLRETGVAIGLLSNGTHLRLVYAPRGETSGHVTFPVQAMTEVAGRPILAALHMLLAQERLFALPQAKRLPALLADSRKYQNVVSAQLSEQVLAALYELLRGFQAADAHRQGRLVGYALREDPDHLYAGLLTVLLRLVFALYAEDRGLLSDDPVYWNHYSVSGLFERLREDAGRYPDTMDQRYGAWAQLLALFRLIYDGGAHGAFRVQTRRGYLFDPDRYNFLEGRPWRVGRVLGGLEDPPLVSDGVVYRVLSNLVMLGGERLSFRSLDVEQIGSVYETVMGFRLQVATGPSIAIKPKKRHGAPVTVDLAELLDQPAGKRPKWLRDATDQDLPPKGAVALAQARTPEEAVAALGSRVDQRATPRIVPAGAMVLQPSEERRRSGSHYTPRGLTEPIVREALRPVLGALGPSPAPEAILDLKVCDVAMGSGAFLVEVDRQLADALVDAWHAHDRVPPLPPDEDEVLHARRLVVQRCLYGVDRNPMAADLAKLSLWLATLARDHPFTFLDHALRCGDSLVGLTREQIMAFDWAETGQHALARQYIEDRIAAVMALRAEIQAAPDDAGEEGLRFLLKQADEASAEAERVGDLVVAAFFAADTAGKRKAARIDLAEQVRTWLATGNGGAELAAVVEELRERAVPIVPFHWELEFPEVFQRANPGFDAMVGNPPFAGKNTLINANPEGYLDWLKMVHPQSHGNADLVAHFYRRAFGLLRDGGAFGLIATNTIAQGDTRGTGLRWICTHGGTIYRAVRRLKWPGEAAVIVSVVHIRKGEMPVPYDLDGRQVDAITAFLFHTGGHEDPAKLTENAGQSFQGSIVLGMGFTFDDREKSGIASPIALMHELIAKDPRNAERIFPYIGGEEVNTSPTHAHHRYVINFGEMTEEEARRWPDLMAIVEERVKPERMRNNREVRKKYWWRFGETTPALFKAVRGLERVLAHSFTSSYLQFAYLSKDVILAGPHCAFAIDSFAAFCSLQSRPHEVWVRFTSSTMKDDLGYKISDSFETFPFPPNWQSDPSLESAGRAYYDNRAELMVRNNEGLTKTYNRFHDPDEPSPEIARLRELHTAMDRAVLDAYGWADIPTACEFLLDHEDDSGDNGGGKHKLPWRLRWPDEVRDEVLGRLLALNRERAAAEKAAGVTHGAGKKKGTRGKRGVTESGSTGHDGERLL